MPSRRCSSRSSTRISARSLASRFESGSSNSSTVGEKAMARASATRCCWPPDSSARRALGEGAHLHQVERALDLLGDLGRAAASAPAAHRRRCRTRSYAATPHRTGTPSTRRASRPGRCAARRRNRRSCRRCGCCRPTAAPARRSRAGSWSCRSPTARAGSHARRCPTVKLTPFTAGDVAVAHDEVGDLDARLAHVQLLG